VGLRHALQDDDRDEHADEDRGDDERRHERPHGGDGEARDRAYAAVKRIRFDGRQLRTDIAARAVDRVGA